MKYFAASWRCVWLPIASNSLLPCREYALLFTHDVLEQNNLEKISSSTEQK
jgi:hypothetical protein